MDSSKVEMMQQQLEQLGFEDMRQQIKKGLDDAAPFTVSCLRYFKHSASGSSDFLQYDVTIDPGQKMPSIKKAHLTLLRVLSSKNWLRIHVGMKQAKYRGNISGMPTIMDGYRDLKAKLDRRVQTPATQQKQGPTPKRLFRPNNGGGKGYPMP